MIDEKLKKTIKESDKKMLNDIIIKIFGLLCFFINRILLQRRERSYLLQIL